MHNAIPKRLFFIWFGNHVPDYAKFCINAFKAANPTFDVNFIHYSISEINKIFNTHCTCNEIDKTLLECISHILDQSENIYSKYINRQKAVYKKNIKSILIIGDIFRLMLVNKFGGIYLDCDTFPMKPFDDELLAKERFCVDRYVHDSYHCLDNYFFGSCLNDEWNDLFDEKQSFNLIQTPKFWYSNLKFIENKHQFFNCNLEYGKASSFNDNRFYIEHYNNNAWRDNTKILTIRLTDIDLFLTK